MRMRQEARSARPEHVAFPAAGRAATAAVARAAARATELANRRALATLQAARRRARPRLAAKDAGLLERRRVPRM